MCEELHVWVSSMSIHVGMQTLVVGICMFAIMPSVSSGHVM